jgi:hypothetical protein
MEFPSIWQPTQLLGSLFGLVRVWFVDHLPWVVPAGATAGGMTYRVRGHRCMDRG